MPLLLPAVPKPCGYDELTAATQRADVSIQVSMELEVDHNMELSADAFKDWMDTCLQDAAEERLQLEEEIRQARDEAEREEQRNPGVYLIEMIKQQSGNIAAAFLLWFQWLLHQPVNRLVNLEYKLMNLRSRMRNLESWISKTAPFLDELRQKTKHARRWKKIEADSESLFELEQLAGGIYRLNFRGYSCKDETVQLLKLSFDAKATFRFREKFNQQSGWATAGKALVSFGIWNAVEGVLDYKQYAREADLIAKWADNRNMMYQIAISSKELFARHDLKGLA